MALFRKPDNWFRRTLGSVSQYFGERGHHDCFTLMNKLQYSTIDRPFEIDFKNSDRKLLREYFEWFLNEIPERLDQLQKAIDSSAKPPFKLDFSRESFVELGKWLAQVVERRNLSKLEIAEWRRSIPSYIDVPTQVLTDQSRSLGLDVGIYLAEAFRQQSQKLKWDLIMKNKKHIEYGKPVLLGFVHGVEFDPEQIGGVVAQKISENTELTNEVIKTYDVWRTNI